MTTPLLPLGGAAIGSLAWSALSSSGPGNFLRALWGGSDEKSRGAASPETAADQPAVRPIDVSRDLTSLGETLRSHLLLAGVDLSQPLTLKEDGHGGVLVDGDHPDRALVENLLASDSELRAAFHQLAVDATVERDRVVQPFAPSFGEFRLQLRAGSESMYFE